VGRHIRHVLLRAAEQGEPLSVASVLSLSLPITSGLHGHADLLVLAVGLTGIKRPCSIGVQTENGIKAWRAHKYRFGRTVGAEANL